MYLIYGKVEWIPYLSPTPHPQAFSAVEVTVRKDFCLRLGSLRHLTPIFH